MRSTDFDFTASTPGGAAVVTYLGESVYACACLAGTPGTILTATATYPKQGIAEGRQVRGVAVQKSVNIPLVPSKGRYDTPECAELAASPRQPSAPVSTVPTPLAVVVNEEWTAPAQIWTVSPGQCLLGTRYTNPNILITDHAIVTSRQQSQAVYMRWTAEVADGSLRLTVCRDATSPQTYSLTGLGPKVNILVLR